MIISHGIDGIDGIGVLAGTFSAISVNALTGLRPESVVDSEKIVKVVQKGKEILIGLIVLDHTGLEIENRDGLSALFAKDGVSGGQRTDHNIILVRAIAVIYIYKRLMSYTVELHSGRKEAFASIRILSA